MFTKAFIPYKGYYSTPFFRWQGKLQNENSIVLAANTSKRWLETKNLDPKIFDYLFLGITIGQHHWFYGSPWAAAMMGATDIPGVTISQACSTSATCVYQAALGIETGFYKLPYCLMTDRCSNGPHTVWPNPLGPGGEVESENWLMDNFGKDPYGGVAMIQTAENVAKKNNLKREDADAVTLRRYEQYLMALENDREFQKRYMFPVEAKISKKKSVLCEEDEGVTKTTKEGLEKLRPVLPGGIHTFGSQTFPADGNCAIIVTTRDKAKELSADPNVEIQVVSYGFARAEKAHMAMAVVPAAQMALDHAEKTAKDMTVIKTHNPFAANDLYMASQLDLDVMSFNNYGSSLIFGHPQGPTVGRLIIEGIEETVMKGGGYMMCAGCAAGDTGAALILKITC